MLKIRKIKSNFKHVKIFEYVLLLIYTISRTLNIVKYSYIVDILKILDAYVFILSDLSSLHHDNEF